MYVVLIIYKFGVKVTSQKCLYTDMNLKVFIADVEELVGVLSLHFKQWLAGGDELTS